MSGSEDRTLWVIGCIEFEGDKPVIVRAFTASFPWESLTIDLNKRYVNITSVNGSTLEECEEHWARSLESPVFAWVKPLLGRGRL